MEKIERLNDTTVLIDGKEFEIKEKSGYPAQETKYWALDSWGAKLEHLWHSTLYEQKAFDRGLVYLKEEDCDKEIKRSAFIHEIKTWLKSKNFVCDWEDDNQEKHLLNDLHGLLRIDTVFSCKTNPTWKYMSEETAEELIEKLDTPEKINWYLEA